MAIQPTGGVQVVGSNANVAVDGTVAVSVAVMVVVGVSLASVGVSITSPDVGVGKLSGRVGGICVGAAEVGRVSASASEMPPSTRMTETMAIMTPPPNWRKACIMF